MSHLSYRFAYRIRYQSMLADFTFAQIDALMKVLICVICKKYVYALKSRQNRYTAYFKQHTCQ